MGAPIDVAGRLMAYIKSMDGKVLTGGMTGLSDLPSQVREALTIADRGNVTGVRDTEQREFKKTPQAVFLSDETGQATGVAVGHLVNIPTPNGRSQYGIEIDKVMRLDAPTGSFVDVPQSKLVGTAMPLAGIGKDPHLARGATELREEIGAAGKLEAVKRAAEVGKQLLADSGVAAGLAATGRMLGFGRPSAADAAKSAEERESKFQEELARKLAPVSAADLGQLPPMQGQGQPGAGQGQGKGR